MAERDSRERWLLFLSLLARSAHAKRKYINIDVVLCDFTVEFKCLIMKKTNFDLYLEQQLKDPVFAERFDRAGEAWDIALQIAALRKKAGLSQKDLARKLKTSQQQISRLESPCYEGHSLSMLRRVAKVLSAKVRVVFEPERDTRATRLEESPLPYRVKRALTRRS